MNLSGFDANTIAPNDGLPAGQYLMVFTSSEMKTTKAGTGQYLQLTAQVIDGPLNGKNHWVRLNLNNPNKVAVDIAQRELSSICRAVGVMTPKDSGELCNVPFRATVGIDKSGDATIKKYETAAGQPAFSANPAANVAPAAAAPWSPAAPATPSKPAWAA